MSLRDSKDLILRKLFPARMKLQDEKHNNKEKLERIQVNVHLTREQWIKKTKKQYKDTAAEIIYSYESKIL